MSIIRVGLSETKKYSEGYEAIFGKKKTGQDKRQKAAAKNSTAKKKTRKKK